MEDSEREEHRIERITTGAKQPIGWLLGAKDLKCAADVLAKAPTNIETEFGIQRVYLMLMGFALENLLKGLLVSSSPDQYVRKDDKLFDWGKDGHNLVKLAQWAGLELSETEVDICRRLSRFSTWAGRYWFPRSVKEVGEGFSPVFQMDADDRNVAERLYEEWCGLLIPKEVPRNRRRG